MITDKKIMDQMFKGYGPLGSFSAKIDVAYLLKFIAKFLHSDLHQIKNIRNNFAHYIKHDSFDTEENVSRINNLVLVRHLRDVINETDEAIVARYSELSASEARGQLLEQLSTPRKSFIVACRFCTNELIGAEKGSTMIY